jgi:hypothetical protein
MDVVARDTASPIATVCAEVFLRFFGQPPQACVGV